MAFLARSLNEANAFYRKKKMTKSFNKTTGYKAIFIAFIIAASSTFRVSTDTNSQGNFHVMTKLNTEHRCGLSRRQCRMYHTTGGTRYHRRPCPVKLCEKSCYQTHLAYICFAQGNFNRCRERAIEACLDNINAGFQVFAGTGAGAIGGATGAVATGVTAGARVGMIAGAIGIPLGAVGGGLFMFVAPRAWCELFDGDSQADIAECQEPLTQTEIQMMHSMEMGLRGIAIHQRDDDGSGVCDLCEDLSW